MHNDVSFTFQHSPALAAMFLLYVMPPCVCHSTPGRPKILGCRSPDKETFSCWWEPGSTDELPTTHRLFYRKERSENVFECPDYQRAGNNSCFFDKAHTSIWIVYNITIMASNSYGSTFSEPVEVDVMDIVQPYSPGNMTLTIIGMKDNPYFLVKWEAPHDIDTRSGWVTLKYQVRVKQEHVGQKQAGDWEMFNVGKQKELRIFSPTPGGNYSMQVRCKLDQGLWSEWNSPMFIQMPNNSVKEQAVLIVIALISAFIALATVGIITAKRKHIKDFLLPPVPGPKIKGFDSQLLKTLNPEDIFSTFNFQSILPAPEYLEQVEYLVVLDKDEYDDITGSNKACQKQQVSNENTSDQKKWNKLSISDYNDKWKLPAIAQNCQDSDPDSSSVNTSNHFSPSNVPQQKPDIYQNSHWDISQKNIARSSLSSLQCACIAEQNEVSITPHGLKEEAEDEQREECKQMYTIKPGEDYSKVSGIYRETVLVIKNSTPIQRYKERNRDDPNKKHEITFTAKEHTRPEEYVAIL